MEPVFALLVMVVSCALTPALTMASMVEARMILFTVTSRKIVSSYHRGQTTFFEVG
jgi:hypothetical protein